MKLKSKVIGTVFGVIASSLVFIAVPVSANAGDCSAADPCMTYAEVDNSGNVVNVIVCQPSVCGPNGSFGGSVNGNKLLPQVAANPVTHDTTGTTGHMTNSVENKVVTVAPDNTFTVVRDNKVETIVAPEVVQTETTTVITSVSASFENTTVAVKTGDQTSIITTIATTIGANQVSVTPDAVSVVNEQMTINQQKTQEEFVTIVNNSLNRLMQAKIDRLIKLLGDWFL